MDYLLSSAADDWFMVWAWRVLFVALGVYVLWTLYARRRPLEAAWLALYRQAKALGAVIWTRWGPLLKSRTFFGGLLMYVSWRAEVSIPAGALEFMTDVLFAASGTMGFVLLAIGRVFASGPLIARIHRTETTPITNVQNADEFGHTREYNADEFRRFLAGDPNLDSALSQAPAADAAKQTAENLPSGLIYRTPQSATSIPPRVRRTRKPAAKKAAPRKAASPGR